MQPGKVAKGILKEEAEEALLWLLGYYNEEPKKQFDMQGYLQDSYEPMSSQSAKEMSISFSRGKNKAHMDWPHISTQDNIKTTGD